MKQKLSLNSFVSGLNQDLQKRILFYNPRSFEKAYELASDLEDVPIYDKNLFSIQSDNNNSDNKNEGLKRNSSKPRNNLVCFCCKLLSHGLRKCFKASENEKIAIEKDLPKFVEKYKINSKRAEQNGYLIDSQGTSKSNSQTQVKFNLLNTIESCISAAEYDQALLNAEFQVTGSKPKVLKLPFAINYHKFEALVDTGANDIFLLIF